MEMTVTELPPLHIRRATPDDAASVAELCRELGYPATEEDILKRIATLASSQVVFVACHEAKLIGWIDVALAFHLQVPPFALIGGLVVKDGVRGLGIGKRLCEAAEEWARAHGVSVIRVTSRTTRTDAHRFYLREGYDDVKTSRVFEKRLS